MVFVVGARRSGTNHVQRLLVAHPDVAGVLGETYLFSRGLAPLLELIHHGPAGSTKTGAVYADRSELITAVRALCDTIFGGVLARVGRDASRLVERTPEHARHLDVIGEVYPDAHVVHVVRDGRDVARSLRSQPWGPATLREAAQEWRSTVEAARRAAPSLRHYHEVRYEDLLADVRGQVGPLYRALGLDISPGVLDAAVAAAGVEFNVDPAGPGIGIAGWRRALSAADIATVEAVAGDVLAEWGYPPARTTAVARGLATRLSRLRRRMRTSLSRRRPPDFEEIPSVVDRLLTAARVGRPADALALLSPVARVRVIGDDGDREARGRAAAQLFEQVVMHDAAFRGTQRRGDVYPGIPTFVVVAAYDVGDVVEHRVLAVTVQRGLVTELSCHQARTPAP